MNFLKPAQALVLGVLIAGPASAAEFIAYEGKDAIQEGVGGEKKSVDNIDFWSNGAPPRKFKILGYLNDKRHKTGLVGMARMAGLESSIAKDAKKVGGDAVILVGSEVETRGYVGQSQTNSMGNARLSGNTVYGNGTAQTITQFAAVQKQHSRYAVIQYLPEESTAVPAPEPASATETATSPRVETQ